MKSLKVAFSFVSLLTLGSALQASTVYNYAFGGLGGDLGSNTHTFTVAGGPSVVATGYSGTQCGTDCVSLSAVDLYSKGSKVFPTNSSDENGLGLTNDPSKDGEVTLGSFIMLDLGGYSTQTITDLNLYTGSSTNGEQWLIAGSNQTPATATSISQFQILSPGSTNGAQDIESLAGDRYIYFTAMNGNVLLGGLSVQTASAAPEPASAGLIGLALAATGMIFRRRFAKK